MANEIRVPLVIDTTQADKKLKTSEFKFVKAGDQAGKGFSKGFSAGVSGGLKIGTGQILKASAAFIGLSAAISKVAQAASSFREFDRGLAEINSILPKNKKLTEQSTEALIDFSTQFGTEQAKQAKAFYAIVSAGIKGTTTQLNTLKASNKAAVAGLVDIDTSATALVSSVNAYSKSGLTATRASDILFATVKAGQTTFDQLASALPAITGLAASLGVEFEDLNGTIGQLTLTGLTTSQAVTGLRGVLSAVAKQSKDSVEAAKELGIEFNTTALKSKGLSGFLLGVIKAANGNTEVLSKLFGRVEALNSVLALSSAKVEDFKGLLDGVRGSAGSTAEAFAEMEKSADFQLKRLDSEFKAFAGTLFRLVTPALSSFASGVKLVKGLFESGTVNDIAIKKLSGTVKDATLSIRDLKEEQDSLNKLITDDSWSQALGLQISDEQAKARLAEVTKQLAEQEERRNEAIAQRGVLLTQGEEGGDNVDTVAKALENKEVISGIVQSSISEQDEWLTAFGVTIGKTGEMTTEQLKKQQKVTSSIIKGGIVKSISGGIQNIATSLAKGENVFENFGNFILSTIGDLAIQLGTFFIAEGIAVEALNAVSGTGAIAAGAALVALGSLLKSASGGSGESKSATSAGVGAGDDSTPETSTVQNLEDGDLERSAPGTAVNITVEGSIFDGDETPRRLAELISEGGAREGILINDVRSFA